VPAGQGTVVVSAARWTAASPISLITLPVQCPCAGLVCPFPLLCFFFVSDALLAQTEQAAGPAAADSHPAGLLTHAPAASSLQRPIRCTAFPPPPSLLPRPPFPRPASAAGPSAAAACLAATMIQFLLLVSRQGKIRLSKWYTFLARSQQLKIAQEAANLALSRNRKSSDRAAASSATATRGAGQCIEHGEEWRGVL
jgi:hypothetical protein